MLKIAAITFDPLPGDVEGNLSKIKQIIRNSQDQGIDLLVFPEGALVGYPLGDMVNNKDFLRRVRTANTELVDFWVRLANCPDVICGSIEFVEDQKTANVALVLCGQPNAPVYNVVQKTHLPNYNVFDDKRNFVNTVANTQVFDIRGHRVGVLICEDAWYTDPAHTLIANGAELLIAINGSPSEILAQDRGFVSKKQLRRHTLSQNTTVPLLYVNLVGSLDEIVFDGDIFAIDIQDCKPRIIDHVGDVSVFGNPKYNCFEYNDNSIKMIEQNHQEITGRFSKTPDIIKNAIENTLQQQLQSINPPFSAVQPLVDVEFLEYIHYMLKSALRNYVIRNGFNQVVLGLSGGLDSAVVASVAADAIGAENVRCLLLPSRYSSDHSVGDAMALCNLNHLPYQKIYIEHAVEQLRQTLRQNHISTSGTVDENLQARVRANILMADSNANNRLLLSTGNKSELSMGYSTLGGDSMGGFNPLKDIYKSVVFALALYINQLPDACHIPHNIIAKPPSAELRPDQKDTDSLPPYNVLDEILCRYLEHHQDVGTIWAELIDQKIDISFERINQIIKMLHRAEYKRRMGCPGVLISQLFNSSRRYPITNMAF